MDCIYFTADGATRSMLSSGSIPNVLSVANFGSKPVKQLAALKEFHPNQPMMCGEYWCGWFDHWFEDHHVRNHDGLIAEINQFIDLGASFNIYMFHGGTNFGFMNGANYADRYQPTITSYDYNSPLTEAGDRTDMYYKLRDTIEARFGKLPPITATETKKKAYGKVKLTESADLFDQLDVLCPNPVYAPMPQYMEEIDQGYGYLLYRSRIDGPKNDWSKLSIDVVHDRAQLYINGEYRDVYERWAPKKDEDKMSVTLDYGEHADVDILLENMGRVNYGAKLMDRKGIFGVRLERTFHFGWYMYPLPMDNLDKLTFTPCEMPVSNRPTFYRGDLFIEDETADTFLRLDGFTKGFVCVNGVNIGRYFNPAGPQKTLYLPAPFLKMGHNEIIIFESDKTDRLEIECFDKPDLGPEQRFEK